MRIGDIETSKHSVDELEIIRNEMNFRVSEITNQLMQAREKFNQTGINSDSLWLNNARLARSRITLNAKQLNVVIKRIRKNEDLARQECATIRKARLRTEQRKRDMRFERAFVNMAKESLAPDVFQWLVEQAQDKVVELEREEI